MRPAAEAAFGGKVAVDFGVGQSDANGELVRVILGEPVQVVAEVGPVVGGVSEGGPSLTDYGGEQVSEEGSAERLQRRVGTVGRPAGGTRVPGVVGWKAGEVSCVLCHDCGAGLVGHGKTRAARQCDPTQVCL